MDRIQGLGTRRWRLSTSVVPPSTAGPDQKQSYRDKHTGTHIGTHTHAGPEVQHTGSTGAMFFIFSLISIINLIQTIASVPSRHEVTQS